MALRQVPPIGSHSVDDEVEVIDALTLTPYSVARSPGSTDQRRHRPSSVISIDALRWTPGNQRPPLAVVVAGIPAALVALVGSPFPEVWPSLDGLRAALQDGWSPGEGFVLGVLAILVWTIWAQLLRHIVVQLASQRRARALGLPMPALTARRGPAAHVDGWLVGGLMVASPLFPNAALAVETRRIPVVLSDTRALDSMVPPATEAVPVSAPESKPSEESFYVVRTWEEQRDCLWTIAERYLADPLRWGELLELNASAVQPSGRQLVEDPQHWVYPGMELRLPADASGADLRPAPPAEAPAAETQPPAAEAGPPASTVVPGPGPADAGVTPGLTTPPPTTLSTAPPAPSEGPSLSAPGPSEGPSSGSRRQMPDPIPLGDNIMRVAAALGLGLPIFAAGGIALRLNRRRRTQITRHRPGRDIARPERSLEPLERGVRAIAGDEAAEWVDAALRVLGLELRESRPPVPPQVTCVRAGELGLEILLAEPSPDAPASFVAVDDGHVWRVDPQLELAELQRRTADQLAALPALVSLGASPEGPLLANLEGLGTLSLEGDPGRVAAFLSGAALELASAPWAEGIDLRVVGGPSALAGVEGVTVVDDLRLLSEELRTTVASSAEALGARPSALAARLDEPGEDWPPTVVVVAGPTRPTMWPLWPAWPVAERGPPWWPRGPSTMPGGAWSWWPTASPDWSRWASTCGPRGWRPSSPASPASTRRPSPAPPACCRWQASTRTSPRWSSWAPRHRAARSAGAPRCGSTCWDRWR